MKLNFEWKSVTVFVLILVVLVINAVISSNNMDTVTRNGGWVTHTYQVIVAQQETFSALKETESAQRNYINTHSSADMGVYRTAKTALLRHLDEIKHLTVDNPAQQARLSTLQGKIDEELDSLQEAIDARDARVADLNSGKPGAPAPPLTYEERAELVRQHDVNVGLLRDIGTDIDAMQVVEQDLLQQRQNQEVHSEQRMRFTFFGATLFSLLLLCAVYALVNRTMEQRREAADAIARREEWLATTLRSIGDAVVATDALGCILFMNRVAERLTGWTQAEATGQASEQVLLVKDPDRGERAETPVAAILRTGKPTEVSDTRTMVARDGHETVIDASGAPMHNVRGKLIGVVVVFHDITARKQAEAELRAAMEAAEVANRAKSQFLANMSHELRTPMNAIIGYSEMLGEEAAEEGAASRAADLQKIHGAGKHLLNLINDILDLSKIEAGRMELFLETFVVAEVVNDMVNTVSPLVAKNNNRLNVQIDTSLPETGGTMYSDLTKVRQNLLNLLSNAAKFTTEGQITLYVAGDRRDGHPGYVFRVADTGVGMTEEQMGRLFEAFSQADPSTTRRFGGTGLGLAIARRYSRMMGGDVTVESQAGKGSVFTMWLPAAVGPSGGIGSIGGEDGLHAEEPETGKERQKSVTTGSLGTVLVIDDDPTARVLMERLLHKEGFWVETAANGQEGIRLARELRPSAITLDVMMPGLDGWTVLTTLKADPDLCNIPVIMLTMVDNKNLGIRLGAAEYMTKPVDRDRLTSVLQKYRCLQPPCPVLLVEDDLTTRQMMRDMLTHAGWTVREAENGQAALEQMQAGPPELILLDLMMPYMDGFEFVARLQAEAKWRDIPVVVLTAKDITQEDRLRLNGYVAKVLQKGAYDREELLNEVRSAILSKVSNT